MIRVLSPADANDYLRLRREALEEAPFAFGSSPLDDHAGSLDFVRTAIQSPDQAIFGAFTPDLVGIVGIYRYPSLKEAHKAYLWGLYVKTVHRGAGLGRALVETALTFAGTVEGVTQVHLAVTDRAGAAARLYESLGFVAWGVEPAALRIADLEVAERHMMRRIRRQR